MIQEVLVVPIDRQQPVGSAEKSENLIINFFGNTNIFLSRLECARFNRRIT